LVNESPLTQGRGLKPYYQRSKGAEVFVAPHAGAWIETDCVTIGVMASEVAPHAGAWIETDHTARSRPVIGSPLTQGRGLKQLLGLGDSHCDWSPLTQGRGLKQMD
jgi:hypothetical protein